MAGGYTQKLAARPRDNETTMELIRKQADNFVSRELNKMESTDTYHVVVNALKSELTNYYRPTDKLIFFDD